MLDAVAMKAHQQQLAASFQPAKISHVILLQGDRSVLLQLERLGW
jgi:hypothetical protein